MEPARIDAPKKGSCLIFIKYTKISEISMSQFLHFTTAIPLWEYCN